MHPNIVGATSEIGGSFLDTAEGIVFQPVVINARTFKTDSDARDNFVANEVFKTQVDTNETIIVTPDATPIDVSAGTFSIPASLTISGVTNDIVFAGTLVIQTADTIEVMVKADILLPDYNLVVPGPDTLV